MEMDRNSMKQLEDFVAKQSDVHIEIGRKIDSKSLEGKIKLAYSLRYTGRTGKGEIKFEEAVPALVSHHPNPFMQRKYYEFKQEVYQAIFVGSSKRSSSYQNPSILGNHAGMDNMLGAENEQECIKLICTGKDDNAFFGVVGFRDLYNQLAFYHVEFSNLISPDNVDSVLEGILRRGLKVRSIYKFRAGFVDCFFNAVPVVHLDYVNELSDE